MRFDRFPSTLGEAMLTGGYPRILDQRLAPADWLAAYIATYLERDVRRVSNVGDLVTYQRMLELAAGRTGQLLSYSALAGDVGVSQPTAKAWLSSRRRRGEELQRRKRVTLLPWTHIGELDRV